MRNVRDPAGDRNVLVTLEKNTPVAGDNGQPIPAWEAQFQRYAKVMSRNASERRVFEQIRAEVDHIVRVPFDNQTRTIKPANWRVKIHTTGALLNIGGAIDVGMRHQTLELQCIEFVQ